MFARRFVFALPSLVVLVACQIRMGGAKSGDSASPSAGAGSAEDGAGKAAEDGKADKVTTGLPATAAHASIAWFVRAVDDVPDAALGGTAQTKVGGAKAAGFTAEIAIGNVAPSVLKTHRLPKTAKALEAVKPITDVKSFAAAKSIVTEAKKTAKDEVAAIADEGDRSNSDKEATWAFEALDEMFAKLEPEMSAKNAPIKDRALASWAALVHGENGETAIEMVQRDLPLYVTLLKTGIAPKRTMKTAPKYVHHAIRYFLRGIASYDIAIAAPVLGIDATDTLRGKNVDVLLVGADVALHEHAPLVLETCGDKNDAAKLRTLPKIKDEATLNADTDVFGSMLGYATSPSYDCVNKAMNATSSTSEALEGFRWLKQKINDHPSNARRAITGWVSTYDSLHRAGEDEATLRTLMMKDLDGFIAKLRAMPRRKELGREDKG